MSEKIVEKRQTNVKLNARLLIDLWHNADLDIKGIAAAVSEQTGQKVSVATLKRAYASITSATGKDYSPNRRPKGSSGPRLNLEIEGLGDLEMATPSTSTTSAGYTTAMTDSEAPVRRFSGGIE